MRTTDAYSDLIAMDREVVTTREASARWRSGSRTTARRLRTLEQGGFVRQLRQGLWALDPDMEPFAVAPYLTAPLPAYVSFWSALSRHEMIEQVPRQISVASLDRTQHVRTSVGSFQIHHLAPGVFGGFESPESGGYLATPEKAVFDTVYIRAAAGTQAFFPELSLPASFDASELEHWSGRIASKRLRTLVERHLDQALERASSSGSASDDEIAGPEAHGRSHARS